MAQWQKGESGNPGRRPNGLGEIREIARGHTDSAIKVLVKVMNDPDAAPSARVGAATALLDRGWGKPAQTINANVDQQDSLTEMLREISERRLAQKRADMASEQAENRVASNIESKVQVAPALDVTAH